MNTTQNAVYHGQARCMNDGLVDAGVGCLNAIVALQRKAEFWASQIGQEGSSMTHKDVEFLRAQIRKLVEAKEAMHRAFDKVAHDINVHTENW